jgi:hypothetical protein
MRSPRSIAYLLLSLVIAFPALIIWAAVWTSFAYSGNPFDWILIYLRELLWKLRLLWFWVDYFLTAAPVFVICWFVGSKGWRGFMPRNF